MEFFFILFAIVNHNADGKNALKLILRIEDLIKGIGFEPSSSQYIIIIWFK